MINDLIFEARRLENNYGDNYEVMTHMSALADALEAATRERDAALARIAELEAENEALFKLDEVMVGKLAARTEQLRTAEARIAEAAKLHRPRKHWNSDREYVVVCDDCTRINRYGIAQWPCPTAVALGLNEGGNEK